MKLNRNGTIARYYSWAYDERYLPYNFCTFFWKLLFALAFAPLIWLSYPFSLDRIGKRIFASVLILGFFLVIAYLLSDMALGNYLLLKIIGFIIGLVVGGLLLIGLLFGADECRERISRSQTYREVTGVIRERKQSVKDKYCPKIDWGEFE